MNSFSPNTALDWSLYTFRHNPEGFLLLGAAAVLLLRQRKGSETASIGALSTAKDKVGEAGNAAAGLATDTMSEIRSMASDATDYAKEATRRASENSMQLMHQAQTTAQETFDHVREQQPLAIALAGIAAGAVIASLLKPSRFERETISPVARRVSEAAVEKAKGAAAAAGDTLKDAIDQRGLNAEGLKEVASDVLEAASASVRKRGNGRGSEDTDVSSARSQSKAE